MSSFDRPASLTLYSLSTSVYLVSRAWMFLCLPRAPSSSSCVVDPSVEPDVSIAIATCRLNGENTKLDSAVSSEVRSWKKRQTNGERLSENAPLSEVRVGLRGLLGGQELEGGEKGGKIKMLLLEV